MTFSTVVFRSLLAGAAVVAAALTAPAVSADTIALIGSGRVAGALGPRFAEQGHDIVYGSRDPSRQEVRELVARTGGEASAAGPAEAAAQADIVVIAVPGGVAEEVVRGLGDLSGKIIIDPTNRVGEGADGYRVHAVETSNGELIQALAPGARVVKAFNTLNYRTMADPGEAGGPVTIPLAGNDAAAKATVAALVEGMGLEPIDLGPIHYAHVLEGMLVVWVNARIQGTPFEFHLRRREVD